MYMISQPLCSDKMWWVGSTKEWVTFEELGGRWAQTWRGVRCCKKAWRLFLSMDEGSTMIDTKRRLVYGEED